MPFTPSHAVVALPFVRTPLVPAAIAIGAMTPDLPLFVRGIGLGYGFTHEFSNVVWTAAVGFVLFLLWRVLLRPAAIELSPQWLARRIPGDWRQRPVDALRHACGIEQRRGYPVLLALSLVLGVLSHIVWDLFTHEGRWGSDVLPVLEEQWGPLQGFKWLQHGSSALGLMVIAIWAATWLARRRPVAVVERDLPGWLRVSWWISLPVILVVAWVLGAIAFGPFTDSFTVQHLAYRVLPPACAVWGALTVVLCILVGIRRR
ncbi:DUF4184 family protein [Microbacterium sp. NPDC055903]